MNQIPLFTQDEFNFIAESNRIENEPGVDFDHVEAFMYVKTRAITYGLKDIFERPGVLEIHTLLMKNRLRRMYGEYRKCAVQVGGKLMPNCVAVPYLMEEWLKSFNKMDKTPWEYHKEFENIHPFVDGNGRTGRLLWAFDLLRRGIEVKPILDGFREISNKDDRYSPNSFDEKRQRYYDAL